MKIYGDMISPFVRMTIVTAHEAGLGGKVQHIVEPVKPTRPSEGPCPAGTVATRRLFSS